MAYLELAAAPSGQPRKKTLSITALATRCEHNVFPLQIKNSKRLQRTVKMVKPDCMK